MSLSPTTATQNIPTDQQVHSAKAKPQDGGQVLSVSAAEFVPGGVKGGTAADTGQNPRQAPQQSGRGQHRGGRGGGRGGGGRRDTGDGGRGGGLSRALQEGAGAREQHPQHSPRPHHGPHSKQQQQQQQQPRRGPAQQQQQQPQQQQQQRDGAQLRRDQAEPSQEQQQQQQRQGGGRSSTGGDAEVEGGDAGRQGSSSTAAGRGGASAGRGRQVVANHLLNFQYETRGPPRGGRGGRGGGGSFSAGRRRPPAYRPQRYDKDKFLQANFRFLVSGAVDTKQFDSDADRMFDWDDVILVDMRSSTPVQCPISLDSPPVCPQITPCGHVFSFGSIMRHLMTHGGEQLRRSAPCPLCYQPLVARELRLVQIHHVQPAAVGDTITFQLLKRPRGSIIPQPVSEPAAAAAAAGAGGGAGVPLDTITSISSSLSPAGAVAEPGAAPGSLDSTCSGSALTSNKWASSTAGKTAAGSAPANAASATPPAAAAASGPTVAYSSVSTPLSENLFAKFGTLTDPRPLWRAAIRELGQQLAEVLSQGGLEADFEAPGLFAAADCLAHRARRFAEHQATQLLQRGVPIGATAPAGPGTAAGAAAGWPVWLAADPQVAGQEADSLIRDAFTLAIDSGKAALSAAEQEQQVAAAFPALTGAASSSSNVVGAVSPRRQAGSSGSRHGSRQQQQEAAAAAAPALAAAAAATAKASDGAAGLNTAQPQQQRQQQPQPQQQQQQGAVQAPKAPEPESSALTSALESQSSRPELFFDHAFSEDEEDEQQQQQLPAAEYGSSNAAAATAGSSGAPGMHSSARSIPGAAAGVGLGADSSAALFGTSPGTAGLLGSSPTTSAMNDASLAGDYYMYQAADGEWLFLHPLNLRCLLHAFGSYAACPPTVTGRVLEMEDMVQDEGSRRRWKFLGHLPLTGNFRLAEVTLTSPALTPAQLAPMAEELTARDKRRRRRVEAARRESRREAAAAAAAAKARQGPSAAELRSMPRLGQGTGVPTEGPGLQGLEGGAGGLGAGVGSALPAELQGLSPEQLEEALAAQAMHESALEAGGGAGGTYGASPPAGGVSFARMAKMGFAASGPALGSSPAAAGSSGGPPAAPAAPAPKGAWGAGSGGGKSAAARLSGAAPSAGGSGGSSSSSSTAAALLTKSSRGGGSAGVRPEGAAVSGGERGSAAGSTGAQQWLVLGGGKEGGQGAEASGGEGGGTAASGGGTSSSKKSKKGMVLFATGQQRRY